MLRVLSFLAHRQEDHCWAHPIDGIVAYVDLIERRVDPAHRPRGPAGARGGGQLRRPRLRRPDPRRTCEPIEITQPEGPSFTVDAGGVVQWQGWKLRVGFDAREGLVLHQISIRDGERDRPLIYRASIAEMVVPYADPSPGAVLAELLRRRRVPARPAGRTRCSWAATASARSTTSTRSWPTARASRGRSRTPICMHEEDFGVAVEARRPLHRDRSRRAGNGGWSSPSSSPSATTTTASTGTCTSTARSSSRSRRPAWSSPRPTCPGRRTPRRLPPASARRTTSTSSRPGWT